ncbi:BadF/BadG/BcrA/BcrD ATPase family protein [Actinoplanes missouriensis]|uniref:N-acetylglucosamine kinase n=1 Tax=Actinoplanes missouriensis TaxID=1866 RepID=UPI0033EFCCB7
MRLVVGVDAGGTASRAVVATLAGEVVGRGSAGPGNPCASGRAAITAVVAAAREALSGLDPAAVVAGVLGLAGASAFDDPAYREAFGQAWAEAGLSCPYTVVGDAVTAFAAGTRAPSGAVLIAGTGAVAASIHNHHPVRVSDGLGWLLGDDGSGHWLGLRALRAAVRSWPSPFATAVAGAVGVPGRDEMIRWAQELPHARIAGLAPLVCAQARAGDPHAAAIVAEAVRLLTATVDDLGPPQGPVVLAGSLLTHDTPVRDGLSAVLAGRGVSALTSGDPAAAAAWLAARPVLGVDAAAAHAALALQHHH